MRSESISAVFATHLCLFAKVCQDPIGEVRGISDTQSPLAVRDPSKRLVIYSQNIGSLALHADLIFERLLADSPHIYFFQEARANDSQFRALVCRAREIGYMVSRDSSKDLACFWRRGLNMVRITAPVAASAFKVNCFALQLKNTRVLLRNVHFPAGSAASRADAYSAIALDHRSESFVEIGDFNSIPAPYFESKVLMPPDLTFRRNAARQDWVTKIDGAIVSNSIERSACIENLPIDEGIQHRGVSLRLDLEPLTHDTYRWCKPAPVAGAGLWDEASENFFHKLLDEDLDGAWQLWHSMAGGNPRPSTLSRSSPWAAGWSVGADDSEVARLWRRYRQAAARRTAHGDVRAQACLDDIAQLIQQNTSIRLENWRQDMKMRGPASRWVKRRCQPRVELQATVNWSPADEDVPDEDRLADIALDPAVQQAATAAELAVRWNVGILRYDRSCAPMPQISKIATYTAVERSVGADPEPVINTPLPVHLLEASTFGTVSFDDLRLSSWDPGHIAQYTPAGAPGLDGWTGDALRNLDDVSQRLLCELLDRCNHGRFPAFLRQARVVGIPKNDGTTDRRPLTVLSVIYRLWAKRVARHTGIWMDQFMPESLTGARRGVSAADAAWKLLASVDQHRVAKTRLHVMAMDQKHCFDRLDVSQLRRLATAVGMPTSCLHALELYCSLERHLFLDGQPTGHILRGNNSRGIPQGCPIAVHFCNLATWAWHLEVVRDCPRVMPASFLDDRVVRTTAPIDVFEAVIETTARVDGYFGALFNRKKSVWSSTVARPRDAGPVLAAFDFKPRLVYLGVDVIVVGSAKNSTRVKRDERVANVKRRKNAIRCLPTAQRGALAADAVQGLYFDVGTVISKSEHAKLTSCVAEALRGSARTRENLRSREMEHLMGPGVHRTCPSAAAIYRWCLQFTRMRANGCIDNAVLTLLWNSRMSSLVSALGFALDHLGIEWVAPCLFRTGLIQFDFTETPGHYTCPLEVGEQAKPTSRRNKFAHCLREFLRDAVAHFLAIRRPRDFISLDAGITSDDHVRFLQYSLMHRRCGPSLVTAGMWNKCKLQNAGLSESDVCVRCNLEPETLRHRLWDCPHNAGFRAVLDPVMPSTLRLPDDLPITLARTGITPKGYDRLTHLQSEALIDYLWCAAVDGTTALACHYRGLDTPEPFAFDRQQAVDSKTTAFANSSAPMKAPKKYKAADKPCDDAALSGYCADDSLSHDETLFVDGSFTDAVGDREQAAGWGLAVTSDLVNYREFHGPLRLDDLASFGGSLRRLSNNTAEVAALHFALEYVLSRPPGVRYLIVYDSKYAALTVRQRWRANSNLGLIRCVDALRKRAADHARLQWKWVKGHADVAGNEKADACAKRGASGLSCSLVVASAAASSNS